jgi:putative lipase involved disintegration of autophagic bodies
MSHLNNYVSGQTALFNCIDFLADGGHVDFINEFFSVKRLYTKEEEKMTIEEKAQEYLNVHIDFDQFIQFFTNNKKINEKPAKIILQKIEEKVREVLPEFDWDATQEKSAADILAYIAQEYQKKNARKAIINDCLSWLIYKDRYSAARLRNNEEIVKPNQSFRQQVLNYLYNNLTIDEFVEYYKDLLKDYTMEELVSFVYDDEGLMINKKAATIIVDIVKDELLQKERKYGDQWAFDSYQSLIDDPQKALENLLMDNLEVW